MKGPEFGIDGIRFMEDMMIASAPDPYSKEILRIGKRYGLTVMQTMGFLAEVGTLLQQKEEADEKEAQGNVDTP